MRKITLTIFSLLLFFAICTEYQAQTKDFRKVENESFHQGEWIKYRVHYGWITAGHAYLEVLNDLVELNDRECFHVIGQGITAKSFDLFFKVRDKYETFIDTESLVSHKFKRRIHEGSFKHYVEIDFDHQKHLAHERRQYRDPVDYEVPANIQDVMSAFYFARTQDYANMKPGDKVMFQNFIDREVHDLQVEFLGREVIKVEGKKYNAVKLQPLVKEGGIYEHDGDLFLWISDDKNRIPLRVESGLIVGSIKVDFVEAKNLKNPLSSLIAKEN